MNTKNTDLAEYGDFEQREQEVTAHIGKIEIQGLTEPILLSQDLSSGCGGKIWECTQIILEYLAWKREQSQHALFKDQTIVEIGAGTGLVGLAVAKLCPDIKQMVITDQINMMNLMQENIKLNHLDALVKAKVLNWGEKIEQPELSNADVILASDCVYHEEAFPVLVDTFLSLTTNEKTIIYLAYRKRRNADKRFFQLAKKKFEFVEVMEDPKREGYTRQGMRLFIVKRKVVK
ncbi:putative methyltransferase-domain-containing protein [Helicostylum pulchrum]|nr:putative methyltransferase-domain-containing protein [Helicostylum pulchrum]